MESSTSRERECSQLCQTRTLATLGIQQSPTSCLYHQPVVRRILPPINGEILSHGCMATTM